MIEKVREMAQIQEFVTKKRAAKKCNSKVKFRTMEEVDMVLKQVVKPARKDKLYPNREGAFRLQRKLSQGANKLGSLDGEVLRT